MKKMILIALALIALSGPAYAIDTDGTLSANSDTRIPSQKAVKTYADTKMSTALSSGDIFVGNVSNVATAVAMSGSCTMTNAGVITCSATTLFPAPKSGNWYLGGFWGQGNSATNTTALVDNTLYAVPSVAVSPISVKAVTLRSSSSSANVGASIKACVYAADGTNGTPGTLLGSMATGLSIADSSTNTNFTFTLDTPATVPAGTFYIAFVQSSTTGFRVNTVSISALDSQFLGYTTNGAISGNAIYGFTATDTYPSGCNSPFGTATANTNVAFAPTVGFQIN